VEKLLREKFKFQTELLLDATRANILGKINETRKRLSEKDNLLIYYAGHGEYDKTVDKSYWLPIDARRDDPTNWIIADDITSNIKRIAAKHILVVSDSCYSGTLTRRTVTEMMPGGEREGYIKKMRERPSRTLMASGGNEPVLDSGGGNNSIFAAAFIKALKESEREVFTAEEIFHSRIKAIVAGKSDQVPEYSSIKNSGDEGGDFVFRLASLTIKSVKPPEVKASPGIVPSDLEKPPKADTFTLDDLEKKAAADKATWNTNLKNMKTAFGKTEEFEKVAAAPDLKITAWQRFLGTYQDKNPYSDEDAKIREKAEGRIAHWQAEKQTLAEQKQKKPEVSTATAPRPSPSTENSSKRITNSIGMEFVLIPAGSFLMGSPSNEPGRENDETQHQVTIGKAFYLQTTEVTQRQWKSIMGNNPSYFSNCGDDCPVEQVSWNDAQEFIRKLNQKEGSNKYRLPTEAEWEYGARAGTTTPFYTGNCISTDQANYDGSNKLSGCSKGEYRQKTVRVKSFDPNAFGLYDMDGNVWEWCQDRYGDYPSGLVTDPPGPASGQFRVLRGGSYGEGARRLRSAFRLYDRPNYRGGSFSYDPKFVPSAVRFKGTFVGLDDIGFRVAREY
jgi:formylglycine-generating enzyme required for sulfatase activity